MGTRPERVGESYLPKARMDFIVKSAEERADLVGNVAELGVAYGGVMTRLATILPEKIIYAFDTFEGFGTLPSSSFEASPRFTPFHVGTDNRQTFEWKRDWGTNFVWDVILDGLEQYDNIEIRKGIFPRTTDGMSNETFCLVHLDADIYSSTLDGLMFFYPRMVKGGIIIIDDFYEEKRMPGVREAVEDYFGDLYSKMVEFPNNGQGYIVK